jgi:hypothetical protein
MCRKIVTQVLEKTASRPKPGNYALDLAKKVWDIAVIGERR